MTQELANKTIWITGASSGVGEGMATVFHREGANLIISGRREAELERVRASCTGGSGEVTIVPRSFFSRWSCLSPAMNGEPFGISRPAISFMRCSAFGHRSKLQEWIWTARRRSFGSPTKPISNANLERSASVDRTAVGQAFFVLTPCSNSQLRSGLGHARAESVGRCWHHLGAFRVHDRDPPAAPSRVPGAPSSTPSRVNLSWRFDVTLLMSDFRPESSPAWMKTFALKSIFR